LNSYGQESGISGEFSCLSIVAVFYKTNHAYSQDNASIVFYFGNTLLVVVED